jgi:phosphohistidine phosphatase
MASPLDGELANTPWVLALVSDAVRAQQTWESVSEAWDRNVRVETAPEIYEADVAAIAARVRQVETADAIIVVGHNPGLEDSVRAWVGDDAPFKFPTSAFAVLECDEPWRSFDRGAVRLRSFHVAR